MAEHQDRGLTLPLGKTEQCRRNRAEGLTEDPHCISSPITHDHSTKLLSTCGEFIFEKYLTFAHIFYRFDIEIKSESSSFACFRKVLRTCFVTLYFSNLNF